MRKIGKVYNLALIFTLIMFVMFFAITMLCAESISHIRVPTGESASYERISDLINSYSDVGRMHFIPSEEMHISEVSLRRAWIHRFTLWKKDAVFKVPLTTSDHFILTVLSISVCVLVTIPFISLLSMGFLGWLRFIVAFIIVLPIFELEGKYIEHASYHIKEYRDGLIVSYNSEDYRENPGGAKTDNALLRKVKEFEEMTGWKVVWTDNPYILAWPQLEHKQVIMTVGWIVISNRKNDKRRLPYLSAVLRNIRHAIEDMGTVEERENKSGIDDALKSTRKQTDI